MNFSVSVHAGLIWFWYVQCQALEIDLTSIWKEVGHLMHAKQSNESNSAIEFSIWIEEDVKKSLLFNRIYFGQQMLNTCKKRCYRALSKKSLPFNRIYFGQQMLAYVDQFHKTSNKISRHYKVGGTQPVCIHQQSFHFVNKCCPAENLMKKFPWFFTLVLH